MKKILSVLLSLALLVSSLAGCGSGNNSTVTQPNTETTQPPREVAVGSYHKAAESFAGGSGTEADPFQISEAGHLVLLHEMLKKEEDEINFDDTYVKGHYILTADISLNDTSNFANWSTATPEFSWLPIGAGLSSNSFAGVLDGNGHKITGMFMDMAGEQTESDNDYYGLFAELKGTVKNLTIENSYMRVSGSTTEAGTIAGRTFRATIENCIVDSVIEFYNAVSVGGITGNGGTISNCAYAGTINQLGEDYTHIGGISGSNEDVISNCVFTGTLNGKGYAGGIVGYGANVKNSVNQGTVIGDTAGGILGRVYAAGTNLEIENPHYVIENNTNEGSVTAVALAGGIVGWMGNDESDISISMRNCKNNGQVTSDKDAAGVIGKLSVERTGEIKIENCVNTADVSGKEMIAGIICHVLGGILHQEGNATISGCKNTGNVVSEDALWAGGIIAFLLVMGEEVDLALTLDNCSNEGAVKGKDYAGGIVAFSNINMNAQVYAENMNFSDTTKVTINKCNNTGDVTTTTYNSMAGGIIGAWGLGYISAEISNCVNSGNVAIDFTLTDEEIAGFQDAEWTEIYQIGGGVVGRIGDALKLTTAEVEETDANRVNTADGNILISGCRNTGTISAPDYSYILNKWGYPLFVNYLGGVVGQCGATNGYAFSVENCTYSGAERGLGDSQYPDFGTKA